MDLPFQDRKEAGHQLGAELAARKLTNVVVLALPRGGVPVATEIAAALSAPLDVVIVRKLGVPWQPELAMGAICGTTRVLEREEIDALGISQAQIDRIAARETREAERREELYRWGRPAVDLDGKTVVLVDDGLATGSSMTAAARHVRSLHPAKLIVAVPVGSTSACRRMESEADECVCLARPEPFFAVGNWYIDFEQVTDEEVQQLMSRYVKA